MKILLVSHGYPPRAQGGTEQYTAELARGLAREGHSVDVFAARKEISLPDLSWQESQVEGVRLHELVNNLFHESFEQTWSQERVAARFAERLARVGPQVVHFQHLLYWSFECAGAAAASGARVYFTLHDDWLSCPRFGQRRHPDGGLCERVDFERCGTCLSDFKFAQSPLERGVGRALAGIRSLSGLDLGPLARRAGRAGGAGGVAAPDPQRARDFASAARVRMQDARERVLPAVRRFFAPSRFLRERFVSEWGLEEERVLHLPFGFERASQPVPRSEHSGPLRIAFLGALIQTKGPQLLLEAWGALDPALRARAQLHLFGPRGHEPEFQAQLDQLAQACGAQLAGPLARADVPALLARTDLLVVPSLWWENSPLVIQEALVARTPLLVADKGGMAELVEPGVDGWRFRFGDAGALCEALAGLIDDPERLRSLPGRARALPTPQEHLAALVQEYAR
ncbi:MAG: glycosyltransferase [Planctomycetes bacterium]|nr:glycosyltransferase [Planctomycetota bacterium]